MADALRLEDCVNDICPWSGKPVSADSLTRYRGQVVGFYSFIVVGLAPFGSLQAGWLAEHLGAGSAVLLGGSVCLLGTLWAWWQLGRTL